MEELDPNRKRTSTGDASEPVLSGAVGSLVNQFNNPSGAVSPGVASPPPKRDPKRAKTVEEIESANNGSAASFEEDRWVQ
jgi:hypothetical protein